VERIRPSILEGNTEAKQTAVSVHDIQGRNRMDGNIPFYVYTGKKVCIILGANIFSAE